jgi:hypothetical protein
MGAVEVPAVATPVPGPVLFARYAYPPNRLGLCGPDDAPGLLGGAITGGDRPLRELARGFEGAYPYLRLIAEANGIADPLDRRVVEAYWLGSPLTAAVRPRPLVRDVSDRFRKRMPVSEWRWLEAAIAGGSRPVHAFHVLEVFPRAGLLRGGEVGSLIETMDACRIRWGRVVEVEGSRIVVTARRIEWRDGDLVLGTPRVEEVTAWIGAGGPLGGLAPGDWVSLHWGWACDRLDSRELARLAGWTDAALRAASARC